MAEKRLELDDPKIETAPVFRLFMGVANTLNPTGSGLSALTSDHLVAKTHLLFFLPKWQATHLFNGALTA